MFKRTLQDGHVEAAAKDDFDPKQYTWFKYTSARATKLLGARGKEIKLSAGDMYGVKEYTTKEDKILCLHEPKTIIKLAISKSEKLMDDKSKEFKGKTPTLIDTSAPSKKVKIDLDAKPAKAPKAKPNAAEKKVATLKKKLIEARVEIARLSKLKQNAANLRKISAAKAEVKKLKVRLKEAEANVSAVEVPKSTVQSPARVKETSAPVNPVKETKKIGAKKVKITITPQDDDDDDLDLPPHGHVRYGGGLIDPDELDFDDDTSNLGINLPIDESWSSEVTDAERLQAIRKSKRPHADD